LAKNFYLAVRLIANCYDFNSIVVELAVAVTNQQQIKPMVFEYCRKKRFKKFKDSINNLILIGMVMNHVQLCTINI